MQQNLLTLCFFTVACVALCAGGTGISRLFPNQEASF
jgi:hypothetical protein